MAKCGQGFFAGPQQMFPVQCQERKKVEENKLTIIINRIDSADAIKFEDARDSQHVSDQVTRFSENGQDLTLVFETLDDYNAFVQEQERG